MKFVKIEDLKDGMRIARPIYSKKGVLLFERDSRLNQQGIDNIRNFGLLGLFVLEPAEPAPPMTQADIEFERFQTVHAFSIQDELHHILNAGRPSKLPTIVADIIKSYGYLDKKINFVQSLRTKEDYIFRHALNVAMLCAIIGHKYNMRAEDINETVTAAIMHDIGKLSVPKELMEIEERTIADEIAFEKYQQTGFELIENLFMATPNIRRICSQTLMLLQHYRDNPEEKINMKLVEGTKVMVVAEFFDTLTAMRFGTQPESELSVIKKMQENPEVFDPGVVRALIDSINILNPGISVVLNTGDTALVISENPRNILRPMVLCFKDNSIMDLNDDFMYGDIEVVDVMRTMDNRHVMNNDMLKTQGANVEPGSDSEADSDEGSDSI